MQKKQNKGSSVQELLGIKSFTRYGLLTKYGEFLFFSVSPTNITVLSNNAISTKIHNLMMVLSAYPDIEIVCTDSRECFDENKVYLQDRLEEECNPMVQELLKKDIDFLSQTLQAEMARARQFLFLVRCRNQKPEQVFRTANDVEMAISKQGFETRRLKKPDIKRLLAVYFETGMNGDAMPDIDGEQYIEEVSE